MWKGTGLVRRRCSSSNSEFHFHDRSDESELEARGFGLLYADGSPLNGVYGFGCHKGAHRDDTIYLFCDNLFFFSQVSGFDSDEAVFFEGGLQGFQNVI